MIKIYYILKSLKTTNILLTLLISLFIYGAIIMPGNASFKDINTIAFFKWLKNSPPASNWWLYGSILILIFLVLNTIVCSIESILNKRAGRQWLLTISPQIIHIGFCFALLAHLISGIGSYHQYLHLYKGYWTKINPRLELSLKNVTYRSESGFTKEIKAEILYRNADGKIKQDIIFPNNPSFVNGIGIYLNRVSMYPAPAASVEISYEPGAIWALIGSILFIIGTVTLVLLKMRDRSL